MKPTNPTPAAVAAARAREAAAAKTPAAPPPTFLPTQEAPAPSAPTPRTAPPRQPAPVQPPPAVEEESGEPELDPVAAVMGGGDAALKAIRKALAPRSSGLDLGSFFVDGRFTQTITVVPGKLVVTLRSLTSAQEDEVENSIAREMRALADQKVPVTGAVQTRLLIKHSVASHVVSYNAERWPEALDARLARVDTLPSPVRSLLGVVVAWFEEDTATLLNVEAVKNG